MTYWADNIKFVKDIIDSKYKKIEDAVTDVRHIPIMNLDLQNDFWIYEMQLAKFQSQEFIWQRHNALAQYRPKYHNSKKIFF